MLILSSYRVRIYCSYLMLLLVVSHTFLLSIEPGLFSLEGSTMHITLLSVQILSFLFKGYLLSLFCYSLMG